MESYKILLAPSQAELVEKKSRFIARIKPVASEEEALSFIEENRKQYWDARHHCFAFVIGDKHQTQRCSDDGEPSQTAGRPMLDVILGEDVHDVCVVVTRYFGGTLLGTGGLVRAYGGAVKLVLGESEIILKRPGIKIKIAIDYTLLGKIQYLTASLGIRELENSYTDKVELTYLVPEEQVENLTKQVTEATSGKVVLEPIESLMYGTSGKELYLNI